MALVRTQKGMTLVEVLAVIVILSIISILSMQVFTNGMNFSDKESSEATLQQQYNYVLTVWREVHESGNKYRINVSSDKKSVTFTQLDASGVAAKVDVIEDIRFKYELKLKNGPTLETITMKEIDPKINKKIHLEINILNLGKGTPSYKASTVLSRL